MNPALQTPLLHFEQKVNDRRRTSQPPAIEAGLLPESGASRPLAWRRVPEETAEIFSSAHPWAATATAELVRDGYVYLPVHPLEESALRPEELVHSGRIQVSASYRTVFFEPEPDGLFHGTIPAGQVLMIKLHLAVPLPGIPGDRRLTRDKVEKCVLLSDALAAAVAADPLGDRLEIVPEFLGLVSGDVGTLFRLLPASGVLPAFALYSRDADDPDTAPLLLRRLDALYGSDRLAAARALGDELAGPLIRSLAAGMRAGFFLEMHAQNTLLEPGTERLVQRVLFRDLEGVVFSDRFRRDRGLPALFPTRRNAELLWPGRSMRRWYNRNLDHDVGRILQAVLETLEGSGYFDRRCLRLARRAIRGAVRDAVAEAGLSAFHWPGRLLPFTRSPYGNGTRLGHYYRSRYR